MNYTEEWLLAILFVCCFVFMFLFAGTLTYVDNMEIEEFDKYTVTIRP